MICRLFSLSNKGIFFCLYILDLLYINISSLSILKMSASLSWAKESSQTTRNGVSQSWQHSSYEHFKFFTSWETRSRHGLHSTCVELMFLFPTEKFTRMSSRHEAWWCCASYGTDQGNVTICSYHPCGRYILSGECNLSTDIWKAMGQFHWLISLFVLLAWIVLPPWIYLGHFMGVEMIQILSFMAGSHWTGFELVW